MADTLVDGSIYTNTYARGMFGSYWSDKDTGIIVFISDSEDVSIRRTTNAGLTWTLINVQVGTAQQLGCCFDREVPGDMGSVVHIAWLDSGSNELRYRGYDISLDSFVSSVVNIVTGITVALSVKERVAIGKTRSGNIIVGYETAVEYGCIKTSDEFATAGTVITDIFEAANISDRCLLFPANTGDDNDMCAIFMDRSASTLSIKMYDDSANTWTESAISGTYSHGVWLVTVDASIRHSDSKLLIVAHSNDDSPGDDLKTIEVSTNSIVAPIINIKNDIFTNQGESSGAAIVINQQTDDVYVAYLKGGVLLTTVDVVYHRSTDGMTSWGAEQAYSEAAADDIRLVHGGHTVGNSGGRIQFCFFNHDLVDLFINENNDISISGISGKHRSLYMSIEYEGVLEDITPSDSVDVSAKGMLYIGTAGDVVVTAINNTDGTSVTLKNVPSGTWLNFIRVKRVWSTGTTATDIVLAR